MHIRSYRSYVFILLGAGLWGTIGIYVKYLQNVGFTSMEITTIRVVIAFLFLLFIGLVKYRQELNINIKHIPLFIGSGIFSIVFFNWSYFTAIEEMSISVSVVLLYTAPAFVALLSWIFLGEEMNGRKIVSVVATIIGCVFITGLTDFKTESITTFGLLMGISSGFGYALYTIFGRISVRFYSSFTITFYTFLAASLFLLPVSKVWQKGDLLFYDGVFLYSIGLGFIPTVLAYILYTEGLKKVEGSVASIFATVEPVVALLIGLLLFDESFQFIQWIGTLFILFAVVNINRSKKARPMDLSKSQISKKEL
ncbi:DMT family transporter [Fervidibacillus halotolerans]|uniref:EamA family transporter n=1 Tax=Fervidibacillus halotolerans TaxID=2980027 RepID=A0A9E8RZL3_9BACI|nr:EamA family transporter [Fervidibacillus halotolerans]WAA13259.1 EamA family transporter [Fervidibacillus halotolerans]